jgi:hypothetical protein
MDQYVPPIYAIGMGSFFVLSAFYLRIPFFIVGLLSLLLVIYALQDHLIRFGIDYKNFSAPDFLKQNASVLIIAIVILFSIGFLILKFGAKAIVSNQSMESVYGRQESPYKWTDSLLNQKT